MFTFRPQENKDILVWQFTLKSNNEKHTINNLRMMYGGLKISFAEFKDMISPFGNVTRSMKNFEEFTLNKDTIEECLELLNAVWIASKLCGKNRLVK